MICLAEKKFMKQDELFAIFKKTLVKIDSSTKTEKDLVHDVVAEYLYYLMRLGNVPHFVLSTIEEDVTEEVVEMYRKTTYGFHSLHEFKTAKKMKFKTSRTS